MLAKDIFGILMEHSNNLGESLGVEVPLYEEIRKQVMKERRLVFLLPAFPAKSPSPKKTAGHGPDMGEVLAMQGLQKICDRIKEIYAPGAEIIICSDGRVFSDVVHVSDELIDEYSEGIEAIIEEFELKDLSTVSMEKFFKGDAHEQRAELIKDWCRDLQEVRELVVSDPNYSKLFNGMHRFLIDDLASVYPEKSKNKINQESKLATYELMRRSDGWSKILATHFPGTLRLSIHPYPLHHEKFGVKLVQSSSKWGTPWHNVVVKMNGNYELMHMQEALKLNGERKLFKEKYVYFEV